ncbi:uncharacterized protein LOC111278492 [Durio zibethinus]|uniref:Uncharacterized protein LOC111278492 n=1 Tax=Durio zibethinus TaxID=66656 RepID=A0A6P5WY71_DURZI|nr:uncharacterized protein LOC111278492 [Durio zibethinus]
MEFVGSDMTGISITDHRGPSRGRMGRRRIDDDENKEFKSKNLHAERRRRQKLSDRLLSLRSIVPIITNMNKATIIEDAITYIQELQKTSEVLSGQLLQMEGSSEEEGKPIRIEIDAAEDPKKCGIKEEVKVTNIDGNKLLIKIILEKKRGCFTKLIEAMNYLGFELSETNVTTFKGAMRISSCVQGIYGDTLMVEQTEKLLLEIIRSIRDYCLNCEIKTNHPGDRGGQSYGTQLVRSPQNIPSRTPPPLKKILYKDHKINRQSRNSPTFLLSIYMTNPGFMARAKVLPPHLSFMARFRHLGIILAAECFSFIVKFQATNGSRIISPEAGIDADTLQVEMIAEGPVIRAIGKHYSSDKSAAGGDVILGGFVMAVVVAVVCYLRITRRSLEAHT